MKDLQELATQCQAELASIGIPFRRVKIWSINCGAKTFDKKRHILTHT